MRGSTGLSPAQGTGSKVGGVAEVGLGLGAQQEGDLGTAYRARGEAERRASASGEPGPQPTWPSESHRTPPRWVSGKPRAHGLAQAGRSQNAWASGNRDQRRWLEASPRRARVSAAPVSAGGARLAITVVLVRSVLAASPGVVSPVQSVGGSLLRTGDQQSFTDAVPAAGWAMGERSVWLSCGGEASWPPQRAARPGSPRGNQLPAGLLARPAATGVSAKPTSPMGVVISAALSQRH